MGVGVGAGVGAGVGQPVGAGRGTTGSAETARGKGMIALKRYHRWMPGWLGIIGVRVTQ